MTLKQLKKRLNPVAQKVGLYTAYRLDKSERIGVVNKLPMPWHDTIDYLTQNGYETPPKVAGVTLTATKLNPDTGSVHDKTYRKVDADNPRWQWHIHLWKMNGLPVIYSHYEMRPDFKRIDGEDTAEMIGRLKIHYRPEYGTDYYQGKADPVVKDLVND